MALKFENPVTFNISRPSGVGKTKLILCFVDNIDRICSGINQVFHCFKVWQGIFDKYSVKIRFCQGHPVLDDFKEFKNCF